MQPNNLRIPWLDADHRGCSRCRCSSAHSRSEPLEFGGLQAAGQVVSGGHAAEDAPVLLQPLRNETSKSAFEDSGVEVLGSRDGCGRIQAHGLESIEASMRLSVDCWWKNVPVIPSTTVFGRSAAPKRDDRPAARHGFDRNHAEVLLTRKDQPAAARVQMPELMKRLRPQYCYSGTGKPSEFREHLTAADHHKLPPGSIASLDGKFGPLVATSSPAMR